MLEELVELLYYLERTTQQEAAKTRSDRIRRIHERVCRVKASEEIGVKYMQAWEERYYDRQEAREEGFAEGCAEGIKAMLEICREFSLTKEEATDKMMQKLNIDRECAQEYLEKFWKD